MEVAAENFFLKFEKVAEMKIWRKNDWAFLVQDKFSGKNSEPFNTLTIEEAKCYSRVKV